MRKRANKEREESKNGNRSQRNFLIGLMILSTIAMISAFYVPDPANKFMILGTVIVAFVGYWRFEKQQKRSNGKK